MPRAQRKTFRPLVDELLTGNTSKQSLLLSTLPPCELFAMACLYEYKVPGVSGGSNEVRVGLIQRTAGTRNSLFLVRDSQRRKTPLTMMSRAPAGSSLAESR
jgi:hypothetical protein